MLDVRTRWREEWREEWRINGRLIGRSKKGGGCRVGGVIIGYFLLGEYEMHVVSTRNQQELSLCSTNQSQDCETPTLGK